MLQSPIPPSNYSLRERRKSSEHHLFGSDSYEEVGASLTEPDSLQVESAAYSSSIMNDYDDDGSDDGMDKGGGRGKSRRELPAGAVAALKAWLLSPEHFTHPYPTPQDQAMLMQKTGIDKKQLKNWFTNARRRIWKPMLKKQIEQGKLTATGGVMSGLMMPSMPNAGTGGVGVMDNPHSVQAMRVHYQQVVQHSQEHQQQQQQQANDVYTSTAYGSLSANIDPTQESYYGSQVLTSMLQPSTSIGTLPQLSSTTHLSKTDSHAVLMELFARDQDLVRQATESARLKAEGRFQQASGAGTSQHPMKPPTTNASSSTGLSGVPTLNSWPHFSSVTSLNNLGTMPGVKSITSMSGADLASKGNVNNKGNLAQVKSMESMGKNDSYAFLEVFFGDRSSGNLAAMGGGQGRTLKQQHHQHQDDEGDIGLSLEDESPMQSTSNIKKEFPEPVPASEAPQPAPLTVSAEDEDDGGLMSGSTFKRAYDDALAARGLLMVSRSSERLTDLDIPVKIQRTLSQEYINRQQHGGSYGSFTYGSAPETSKSHEASSAQYPGQQPTEPKSNSSSSSSYNPSDVGNGHVQVTSTTTCDLCSEIGVDTQLRPCGHYFHEKCLKPALHTALGPPKCPVDGTAMQSALLAVPTDGTTGWPTQQQQPVAPKSTPSS